MGDRFTLSQLHDVYEAIAEEDIDLANFRRKMLASGLLEDTGDKLRVGRNRPATVYRYKQGTAQPTPWNVAESRTDFAASDIDPQDDALSALTTA